MKLCYAVTLALLASSGAASATPATKAKLDAALCTATGHGTAAEIKALVKQGANPNAKCSGSSMLVNATYYDKVPNMEALLDSGADVNAATADFDPAIDRARSVEAARLLISRHADVNARSLVDYQHGATPLIEHAFTVGVSDADEEEAAVEVAIAQLLIEAGADVNAVAGNGESALHACVGDHGLSCVTLLLDHGGNPNPPANDFYRSPLGQAVYMQTQEAAALWALMHKVPNVQGFHDMEVLLRAHGGVE